MRNVSEKFVEKIKTRILLSAMFFNHAIYEIMLENIVEWSRPQVTAWSTRIACRIANATDTHSRYAILISFPLQHWLQERASMLRLYLHRLSFYILTLFFG
jgi:hypothetical protein